MILNCEIPEEIVASTKQTSDRKDLNNNETSPQEEMRAENDKDLHSDTLSNI